MSGFKLTIFILLVYFDYGHTKIYITKCCPFGEYVGFKKICTSSDESYSFNEVIVYDKDIRKTGKKVPDVFELVPAILTNFNLKRAYDLSRKYNNYLIEDGSVMQEFPNTWDRWTHLGNDKFCIDIALPNGRNIFEPVVRLWTIPVPAAGDDFQTDSVFNVTGLLISSFFLVLVLIVYSMLPELRNLCGMILMAYVVSLLGAFLMLSTLYIISMADLNTVEVCLGFTFVIYYFFLSCFCWMNVMSVDIWWTFRGYAKARPIHRRGEKFKFAMYCLYAFGLPAAMTVMLGLVDKADLSHIPWFVKPDLSGSGCFLEGSGKFMYLYVPMLIIIVMNWTLFLMTAFNIWRLSRGTAVLDSPAAGNPSAHRTHRHSVQFINLMNWTLLLMTAFNIWWLSRGSAAGNLSADSIARHRLMLYLKLSVIMGVSWVLEVVSSLAPQFRGWYLTDAYNLLMGLFIFLIFVCKKKIFKKLEKKIGMKRAQWSPISKSRSASVSSDSDSQDTTSQICSSPSGASYYKA